MIGFSGDEVIDHIHGIGKEGFDISITGSEDERLGQEGFTGTGIADEDDILVFGDKIERE